MKVLKRKKCWKSVKKKYGKYGIGGSENLEANFGEKKDLFKKLGEELRWKNWVKHLVDKLDEQIWWKN